MAMLCMLAGPSGCGRPDRYTILCRMTGPSTGTDTEYRFPVDEPARRIGWVSAAGFTPIDVDEWSDARLKGRFMVGESSVTIDFDRAQYDMTLQHRNPLRGADANRGSCREDAITEEETERLAEAGGTKT